MECNTINRTYGNVETPVVIRKFKELDLKTQKIAKQVITDINKVTTTDFGVSFWSKYTPMILSQPSDHLYVAQIGEAIVGYVAFYDHFQKEAYCAWTAVSNDYQKVGIATKLKLRIFDEGFESFSGHIKKTNDASLAVLRKFGRNTGFKITEEDCGHQIHYTVTKL